MEWLNDGVGLIAVISTVIIVLMLAGVLSLLLVLRNKIAVQRLNFLGFYATDPMTRVRYADCVIGNRSINEVAVSEIGIRNGKVSFNLTDLYKKKANLSPEARIVIEQRSSIRFSLTEEELIGILFDGKKGKTLKTLRLYVVDLTGNLYEGKIKSVQKLLFELAFAAPDAPAGIAPAEGADANAPVAPVPAAISEAGEAPAVGNAPSDEGEEKGPSADAPADGAFGAKEGE